VHFTKKLTESAEVQVLVAVDATNASFPPAIVMVPANSAPNPQSVLVAIVVTHNEDETTTRELREQIKISKSHLATPRYLDTPLEKPLLFLRTDRNLG
jgi:hypothetical protein